MSSNFDWHTLHVNDDDAGLEAEAAGMFASITAKPKYAFKLVSSRKEGKNEVMERKMEESHECLFALTNEAMILT